MPDLWHLEVANTLIVGEYGNRSTQANTVTWLGFFNSLPIAVDEETKAHAFGDALSLAREHGLSVYDAAYLELAMRRGLPLATLDDKLKTAAGAVGVPLYGVHYASTLSHWAVYREKQLAASPFRLPFRLRISSRVVKSTRFRRHSIKQLDGLISPIEGVCVGCTGTHFFRWQSQRLGVTIGRKPRMTRDGGEAFSLDVGQIAQWCSSEEFLPNSHSSREFAEWRTGDTSCTCETKGVGVATDFVERTERTFG